MLLISHWHCCCTYLRPFHIFVFSVGHLILSFYHHLLPISLFSCSLFPPPSISVPTSLFDHLCFLLIISSMASFSLSNIFFSPHFCLSLIFVLVINHPSHTRLTPPSLSCPSSPFVHHAKFMLTLELLFVSHTHFLSSAFFTASLTSLVQDL